MQVASWSRLVDGLERLRIDWGARGHAEASPPRWRAPQPNPAAGCALTRCTPGPS